MHAQVVTIPIKFYVYVGVNMADALLGGIVINEVLVDPNGANNFDTDGNGTANHTDEYVELYNSSGAAIDISGLELWDSGTGNWFTFPPGSILAAGAHAMVMTGVQAGGSLPTGAPGDLFFDAGRGTAVLNNGPDNIVVLDPNANGGAGEYIQATYNGDTLDNPPTDYAGFPAGATRVGTGEDFGNDIDGFSIQRLGDGGDSFINDQTPTPGTTNVCFTGATRLDTPNGPRRIERLRPGDMLMTLDHGPQPIRWIWAVVRSAADLRARPQLRSVRIGKGALGKGALGESLPRRTLRVSLQHRLLVRSNVAQRMFGTGEVLAPAKGLTGLPGIGLAPVKGPVTYYHILMDNHEILFAEGAPAESLYLGQEALGALSPAARRELCAIFGRDWQTFVEEVPAPARPFVTGPRMHRLVARHKQNRQPAFTC